MNHLCKVNAVSSNESKVKLITPIAHPSSTELAMMVSRD